MATTGIMKSRPVVVGVVREVVRCRQQQPFRRSLPPQQQQQQRIIRCLTSNNSSNSSSSSASNNNATGLYQRKGGRLSGGGQRAGGGNNHSGNIGSNNKSRPPLVNVDPSSLSTPEQQAFQPPHPPHSLLQPAATLVVPDSTISSNDNDSHHYHHRPAAPPPPPPRAAATTTTMTPPVSPPPHIFEIAPTELALYASDVSQLEAFGEQLIRMAEQNRMTHQFERLAALIVHLLQLLSHRQHGLRGTRTAQRLLQACRVTMIGAAAAQQQQQQMALLQEPPLLPVVDTLTTTTHKDDIETTGSTIIDASSLSLSSSSSSSSAVFEESTTHQIVVARSSATVGGGTNHTTTNNNNNTNSLQALAAAIANATWHVNHIFHVTHQELRDHADLYQLEKFVQQVEEASDQLTTELVEQHVIPLSRTTALKVHGVAGAQLTERLLHAVRKGSNSVNRRHNNTNVLPVPAVLYNRCLIAWGYCQRAEDRYDRVRTIFDLLRHDDTCRPTRAHYKSYMRVAAQFDPPTAYHILRYEIEPAAAVPALLGELLTAGTTTTTVTNNTKAGTAAAVVAIPSVPIIELPDVAMYNMVALAYAKTPTGKQHVGRLYRVFDIIDRVKKLHAVTGTHPLDGHSYLALILAYRELLRMTPNSSHKANHVVGTATGSTAAAATLEDLTDRLERLFDDEIHPQIRRHEQAALSQTRTAKMTEQKRALDGHDFVDRDEDAVLFPLSMSWAYDVLMEAYVKSHRTDRALQLLECMLHGTQGVYQTIPRNTTLLMLAHYLTDDQRNSILERCVLTRKYARVFALHDDMECWASLPAPQPPFVAELVEAMLLHAFVHFRASRSKPNGQTFRIAIKAWMRCQDQVLALTHIDNLMAEMINVGKVDHWYTVREVHVRLWMTAYLKQCPTGQRYTIAGASLYPAEHCERILRLIRPMCKRLNIEASHVAMAIRAWSLQEGADIDQMDRLHRVDALLNSIKAEEIPAYPANWVLSTCCRDYTTVEARQVAYKIASSVFMRKNVQLNSRSFELMMDIVYKIRQDETLIIELFKRACVAGLVNQELVWRVCQVVSVPADLQKLFRLDYSFATMIVEHRADFLRGQPPRALLLENLPKEWSANCDRKKKNEPGGNNDDGDGDDDMDTHRSDEKTF